MTAKVVSIITVREAKLLWENARDSIRHALEHFTDVKGRERRSSQKMDSTQRAPCREAFCNMLLKQFDPGNPIFTRYGRDWNPSLVPTIGELVQPKNQVRLTSAELRLLQFLKGLNDSRNSIMHGLVPKDLDLSLAAMSILGLSRAAYRRRGQSVDDILDQDPPIQQYVVEAISYKKLEDYYRFVEAFLAEELPNQYLPVCENCGASSIVNWRCEACFESVESFTCDSCDEEVLLPESWRFRGQAEVVCPTCGKKICT